MHSKKCIYAYDMSVWGPVGVLRTTLLTATLSARGACHALELLGGLTYLSAAQMQPQKLLLFVGLGRVKQK